MKNAMYARLEKATARFGPSFRWQPWVRRWEAIQDAEVPRRQFRFRLVADLLNARLPRGGIVLDAGSGPGSLSARVLAHCPQCKVLAVEANPFLTFLSRRALERWHDRALVVQADLRDGRFWHSAPPLAGMISATSLHWFDQRSLGLMLRRLRARLQPRAPVVVSDTVATSFAPWQAIYAQARGKFLARHRQGKVTSWKRYWDAVSRLTGVNVIAGFRRMANPGVSDDGLPFTLLQELFVKADFSPLEVHWAELGEMVFSCTAS